MIPVDIDNIFLNKNKVLIGQDLLIDGVLIYELQDKNLTGWINLDNVFYIESYEPKATKE